MTSASRGELRALSVMQSLRMFTQRSSAALLHVVGGDVPIWRELVEQRSLDHLPVVFFLFSWCSVFILLNQNRLAIRLKAGSLCSVRALCF